MLPEKGRPIWELAKKVAPKLFSRTKSLDWTYVKSSDPVALLNQWQLKAFSHGELQLLIAKPLGEQKLLAILVFSEGKQRKLVALRGEQDYSGCARLVNWEGIVARRKKDA